MTGEIDLSIAHRLQSAVDRVIDNHDRLEIDMSGTTFMDSTGLAMLVGAYRRLGRHHGAVVVREPTPAVRRVLDVSGVGNLIDIRPSAEQAN